MDTDGTELTNAVLGGFGLLFARGTDEGHERQVNEDGAGAADVLTELPRRFQERQAFDITDRTPDLDDHDVGIFRYGFETALNLVRDVWNDLNGASQVIAPPLLGDDRFIDLSRGGVGSAAEPDACESLVMSEVQIGLRAVVGNEDFAVLVRTHGARIYIDVGIELEKRHSIAMGLHQEADGR